MQGEEVGKGGPKKERVGKDAKEPPKKKAKISPAKPGQWFRWGMDIVFIHKPNL